MNSLAVQHPSSKAAFRARVSLSAQRICAREEQEDCIKNICVLFPYLCSQSRYIIKSLESETQPVKYNSVSDYYYYQSIFSHVMVWLYGWQ